MKQRIRNFWDKLSRLEGRPGEIAFGFSIGVVAGLLPLNPSPMLVAAVVAWALNRSVLSAVAGASTAILYIPLLPLIWLAEYQLGALILPADHPPNFEQAGLWEVLRAGWDIYAAMLVGSIIISAPVTLLTYVAVKRLAARWARNKIESRHSD